MDDFREWLSDNLRYILLGLGIIAVILILFFGIRGIESLVSGDDKQESQKYEQEEKEDKKNIEDKKETEDKKDKDDKQKEDSEEDEQKLMPTEEPVMAGTLEKTGDASLNDLIQKYYTALSNKDVGTLRQLVDDLDPAEANSIENSHYIEGYSNVEVYAKQGMNPGSYVVYASYSHKYEGYDTLLPGVSCLYVESREDGSYYVVSEPDEAQQSYISEATNSPDVQEFIAVKQAAYENALNGNPDLADFLSELGVGGSAALEAEDGSTIVVKSNCNVRKEANTDSQKIGELVGGQKVTKIGQEGEWIKISTDDFEGYVRGDLFR